MGRKPGKVLKSGLEAGKSSSTIVLDKTEYFRNLQRTWIERLTREERAAIGQRLLASKGIKAAEEKPAVTEEEIAAKQKELQKEYTKIRKRMLHRLGVTEQQMKVTPRVTPIFEECFGSVQVVINAMRFSKDGLISAFLEKYDAYRIGERECCPFEAFAISAGIDLEQLLSAIMVELSSYSANLVKAQAFASHPLIMQATIENAMDGIDGYSDRKLIHTALGFLPKPKGNTFIGSLRIGKGNGSDEDGGGNGNGMIEAGDVDLDFVFPSLSDTQKKIGGPAAKMLNAAPEIDEEEEDEDESLEELEARINGE
jgi:hypothetical protein